MDAQKLSAGRFQSAPWRCGGCDGFPCSRGLASGKVKIIREVGGCSHSADGYRGGWAKSRGSWEQAGSQCEVWSEVHMQGNAEVNQA